MTELSLYPFQHDCVTDLRAAIMRVRAALLVLSTGAGKCLGKGTPVLMHDGRIMPVESIRAGDRLMGPDSRPRTVLSTAIGHGPMVEIRPFKGDAWRCNTDHVLTLQRIRYNSAPQYPSHREAVIDIPVSDYIGRSKTFKHRHKLLRTGVDWPARELPLDPYFLGILLGDGNITRGRVAVTTTDPEVVECAQQTAQHWGLNCRADIQPDHVPTYHLTAGPSGGAANPITTVLRDLGVAGHTSHTKFVPHIYKTSDRAQRLAVLAGLMDSDGHMSKSGFDFVSASVDLADDVAFIARSVGLRALRSTKLVKGHEYHRVSISGDCSVIPTRIPRKRAPARRQPKSPMRTGFGVIAQQDDTFYGFELDGDGRFLLGDFTITHNTVIAGRVAQLAAAKGSTTLLLVHRRELVRQSINTLKLALPGMPIGVEAAGWPSMPWAKLHVGMVQTLVRRDFTCKPDIVIIDEAHHTRAPTWEKVLDMFPDAVLIGLTATPVRLDGKGLGNIFDEMVLGPPMGWLVDNKYLAPTRTLTVPASWEDMASVRRTKSGDYRAKDLSARVTERVVADAAKAYMRHTPNQQAIFFGVDTNHSKMVCAKLREFGVAAEHVDGKDHEARRDRIMAEFRERRIQVVGNCDLISEGFDAPSCDVVIMGRHTNSVPVYLQQGGRPMRYDKERPAKVATIVDTVGNAYNLGLVDDAREWSLADGEVAQKPQDKPKPPRPCENCLTAFRGMVCPHCGHYRASTAIPVKEHDVELVEATSIKPRQAQYRRNQGMDRAETVLHLCTNRWQFVQECIKIRDELGYKPGWEWIAAKLVWDQLHDKAAVG